MSKSSGAVTEIGTVSRWVTALTSVVVERQMVADYANAFLELKCGYQYKALSIDAGM